MGQIITSQRLNQNSTMLTRTTILSETWAQTGSELSGVSACRATTREKYFCSGFGLPLFLMLLCVVSLQFGQQLVNHYNCAHV